MIIRITNSELKGKRVVNLINKAKINAPENCSFIIINSYSLKDVRYVTTQNPTQEPTQEPETTSTMKNTYKINDVITLKSGFIGKVVYIGSMGNGDIRPPYNKKGLPTIAGINECIGYVDIIPNNWEILYDCEVNENEVIKIN